MKKFEALQDLPFNIKKGDILIHTIKGILKDLNNNEIPFDPIKETEFFKEFIEIKGKFEIDSTVCLIKPSEYRNEYNHYSSCAKIPARTPLKVIKYIKPQKNKYVIVEFNGANFKISEKDLMEYKEYYFINSSGHIHKDILGKHPEGDKFRKITNNMFDTKEDAEKKLDFILLPTKVWSMTTI